MQDFLVEMVGASRLEWMATVSGLAGMILAVRRSVWTYLFSVPSVMLLLHIYLEWEVWPQAGLYIFHAVLLYAGFYWWAVGLDDDGKVVIERTPVAEVVSLLAVAVAGTMALAEVLSQYAAVALPRVEAAAILLTAVARYLQSRRRLEAWLFWMAASLLLARYFWEIGHMPSMLLHAAHAGIAAWGFACWGQAWARYRLTGRTFAA